MNPIGNGFYLVVGLACVSLFWSSTRSGWENPFAVRAKQAAVLLAAVAILAGLYFTLTRSVWIATGIVVATIIGTRIPRSNRPSVAIAGVLVGCSFLALNWERLQSFKRDQHVSAYEMSQSAGLRPVLASVAWKMFLDRPLLGCGLGQYKQVDGDYLRDPNSDLPLERARPYNQHNTFLALLTETGLLGVGLFVAIGLFWTVDAWKLWNCGAPSAHQLAIVYFAVLLTYFVNGMLHDVTVIPMVHMLLFALAGMCRGLVAADHTRTSPSSFEINARQLNPAT